MIQSIPSPKAEPFKRWLARVGYGRVQEIEDPELATKRTRALYKAKGYSDDWIEKRMRSIAIRDELTDEWKKRGVREQLEYSILAAKISKAAFGLTPSQYAELKRLKRENLRDHMTDLELIFSMLGEAATTEIARNRDAQGFTQNKPAARPAARWTSESVWRTAAIGVIFGSVMSVTIQLDLPEGLIQQARKMGLLENQRVAELLADEVRRRNAGQELKNVLDEIRSAPGGPLSMDEINAEIKAARAKRHV